MGKALDKPKKYENRLEDALHFDADDLEANVSRKLSNRQAARLNRERQRWVSIGVGILLIGSFILLMIFWFLKLVVMSYNTLVTITGISLFFILLAEICFSDARKLSADLQKNTVAIVEGRVELSMQGFQNTFRYLLRVGDVRFRVKQNVLLVFKTGDPYRIYYAPRSQRILSVEWLRENDDNLLDEADLRDEAGVDLPGEVMPDRQKLSRSQ